MRNIGKLTYDDLDKEINYAVANNITTTFIVMGDVLDYIVDYLECEHNIPQWTEDGEPEYNFEYNIVYNLTYYDGEYYVQEAYYQREDGEVLASFGDEDEVCYIQMDTDLTTSDIKRIECGDIILFDFVEDDEERLSEDTEDNLPLSEGHKDEKALDKQAKDIIATYKVNGKEVSKEEYNKVSKEFTDKFKELEERINKFERRFSPFTWWL